jgi:hypothetical protein
MRSNTGFAQDATSTDQQRLGHIQRLVRLSAEGRFKTLENIHKSKNSKEVSQSYKWPQYGYGE